MNILYYLKLGITMFLAFAAPVYDDTPEYLIIKNRMSHILTDDMIKLLHGGVDFEFDIYTSFRHNDEIYSKRYVKKLSYDRLNEKYCVEISLISPEAAPNDTTTIYCDKLDEFLVYAASFEFHYEKRFLKNREYSYFCEVNITNDEDMEKMFGIKTRSLWNYYAPSFRMNILIK